MICVSDSKSVDGLSQTVFLAVLSSAGKPLLLSIECVDFGALGENDNVVTTSKCSVGT